MAIPKVVLSLVEGALGIPPEQTDNVLIVFGYSSTGTVGQIYDFDQASPSTVKSQIGVGRGPQLVATLLATPNHGPVKFVPLAFTAGTNSAVSSSGSGTPPVITLTGTPHDDFNLRVEVVQTGTLGVWTLRYSLDYSSKFPSQATWSAEIVSAATVALPDTGITLNIAAGTAAADNVWTATCTAPTHSNTQITDGIDLVIAAGTDFGWGWVTAANGGASDAARMSALAATFAAVSARIDLLEAAYKYVGFTLEAPSPFDPTTSAGLTTWRSAFASAVAALAHKRMMIAAGYCRRAADMTIAGFGIPRRPIWTVAERLSSMSISTHLGEVKSGPSRSVVSLEHDEEATGGLDSLRLTTMRTIAGRQGFYVTRGNQFATVGSDYSATPRLRVINTASKTLRNAALFYLNSKIIVDSATGRIREDEAMAIDSDLSSQLDAVLVQPQHASSVAARVSRTDAILSTSTLNVEGAVQPVGYGEQIPISLGFTKTTAAAAA